MNRLLLLLLALMLAGVPMAQAQRLPATRDMMNRNVQFKTTPVKTSDWSFKSSNMLRSSTEYLWDFEDPSFINSWTFIDNDGDGYCWEVDENYGYNGPTCMVSASYINDLSLDPDNWMISPQVPLGGTLSFRAMNYSDFYADQFAVYVCVGEYDSLDDFVKVSDMIIPGTTWTEYTVDLSQYSGQTGHFAFRHFNSYDNIRLFIDNVRLTIDGTPTPKTETPVISWYAVSEDGVEVSATGNGHICLYIEDELVAEGEGYADYFISATEIDEEYSVAATAQEDGKAVSDFAVATVEVPALPVLETPAPIWNYELTEDAAVITAVGEGTVTLYIQYIDNATGEVTTEAYSGDGVVAVEIPRTEETCYINLWAVAQIDGYNPGMTEVEYFVEIPAKEPVIYVTPDPVWVYELTNDAAVITATGEGTVTLYIQYIDNATGEVTTESYNGEGEVYVEIPRTDETCYVNIWAVAIANVDGAIPGMTSVEYFVEIPAREPTIHGDVNGNGVVDIADITSLIDYLLNGTTAGISLEAADFDNDGNITISDVTSIIDFILNGPM